MSRPQFTKLSDFTADIAGGIAYFKSIQASHDKVAHLCAVGTMAMFLKDGNLESAKQFRDVLNTNAKQRQFTMWLCDMSNKAIQFADNKFSKHPKATDEMVQAIDIAALEAGDSFLKYKQEAKVTVYNAETVRDKVLRTIKSILSSDKQEAVNDEHLNWVRDIESEIKAVFASKPCPAIPADAK